MIYACKGSETKLLFFIKALSFVRMLAEPLAGMVSLQKEDMHFTNEKQINTNIPV